MNCTAWSAGQDNEQVFVADGWGQRDWKTLIQELLFLILSDDVPAAIKHSFRYLKLMKVILRLFEM